MCGRYSIYSNPTDVAKIFGINQNFSLIQSYNVAPTEDISVIVALREEERVVTTMRWGLIPSWKETKNSGAPLVNARAETINVKPAFRNAVKDRRCLVIANGFFEWKLNGKIKQPYFIHKKDSQPFALAGIWEKWLNENESIDSCCLITLAANEKISPYHDRMPAIINPINFDKWLNPNNKNWEAAQKLMTFIPEDELEIYPVSTIMNNGRFKGMESILRIKL